MAEMFASAKAVFRRARHHIDDLHSAMTNMTRREKPFAIVVEHDPHFGKYVLKAKFDEDVSLEFSCIMFDAINNLRSCLDQMTDAVAVAHRGESKHFAQFPFAADVVHWPDRINGLKDHIPDEVRTLFAWFKPYKGGNDSLWALNYLANLKKHKILVPVGFGTGATLQFPGGFPPGGEFVSVPPDIYRKDEIVILTLPDAHPVPQVDLRPIIVIDNPEKIIDGKQPVPLLTQMSLFVKNAIFDTEEVCKRIGLAM